MARTTVEDCLLHVPNRYELVLLASKRSRQLSTGAAIAAIDDEEQHGEREKTTVLSLREIGEGLIDHNDVAQVEETESVSEASQLDFESILRGFEEADRELEAMKGEEETENPAPESNAPSEEPPSEE